MRIPFRRRPSLPPLAVLLLNSGGPDSLIAGALIKEDWGPDTAIVSLYLDFNPRNGKRAEPAARRTARLLGAREHHSLAFPHQGAWWFENRSGYWANPYLALWVHVVGAQYALHRGIEHVVSGFRGDASGAEFPELLQKLLVMTGPGNDRERCPILHLPLAPLAPSYEVTVAEAKRLSVGLADTWSCNRYPSDGTCKKCRARERLGLPVS